MTEQSIDEKCVKKNNCSLNGSEQMQGAFAALLLRKRNDVDMR